MIKIDQSVVIDRPLEEVFAFLTDFDNLPQWDPAVLEAKMTSEGTVGVGTTLREVFVILGRRIESTGEVTAYEPFSKFAFETTSGPMPAEVSETFESVEGGTRLTFTVEAEIGGLFKLAESMVARMLKRQAEGSLANLKNLLETQG